MAFTPIGDSLSSKLSTDSTLKRQIESADVVEQSNEVFSKIFGKEVASHIRPLFVKNRTLTVSCTTSAIAQEIRIKQQDIVMRINEKVGRNELDRVRYLV